jgi:hypothetical protein
MTTMQRTADVAVSHATPVSPTARVSLAKPLAAVALAAALGAGIVGGAVAAIASQTVFNDRAAEQARLLQFAEQLKYAQQWDDLHRQMYPYAQ